MSLRQIFFDEIGAEAAGPAGDQKPHELFSLGAKMSVSALHAIFPIIGDGLGNDLIERRELDLAEIAERAARVQQNCRCIVWLRAAEFPALGSR